MKILKKVLLILWLILFISLIILNIYQYTKNNDKIIVYKIEETIKNDIPIKGAFFKTNNSLFLGIVIYSQRYFDEDTYKKLELYTEKDNQLLKTENYSKYMILNDYDLYHNYLDKNNKLTLKIYYKDNTEEEVSIEFKEIYQNSLKNTLDNLKIKSSKEKIIEKINNTKNKLILNMIPQSNFYVYMFDNHEAMTYMPEDNTLSYYHILNDNENESYYLNLNKLELLYTHTINDKDDKTYFYNLDSSYCKKEECQDYKDKKENFDKLILKIIS